MKRSRPSWRSGSPWVATSFTSRVDSTANQTFSGLWRTKRFPALCPAASWLAFQTPENVRLLCYVSRPRQVFCQDDQWHDDQWHDDDNKFFECVIWFFWCTNLAFKNLAFNQAWACSVDDGDLQRSSNANPRRVDQCDDLRKPAWMAHRRHLSWLLLQDHEAVRVRGNRSRVSFVQTLRSNYSSTGPESPYA